MSFLSYVYANHKKCGFVAPLSRSEFASESMINKYDSKCIRSYDKRQVFHQVQIDSLAAPQILTDVFKIVLNRSNRLFEITLIDDFDFIKSCFCMVRAITLVFESYHF